MARRALIVGINYIGSEHALRGCGNDVINVRALLSQNGFANNIIVLSDAPETNPHGYPNNENIIAALTQLIASAQPGDELFFHVSCHGSQLPDQPEGEEGHDEDETHMDDCIVPAKGAPIRDDTIKVIINNLPVGARLLSVFDCCKSGTGEDLSNNLDASQHAALDQSRHGALVLLSGCLDEQKSAETKNEGKPQGAMTTAFLKWVYINGFQKLMDLSFSNSREKLHQLRDGLLVFLKGFQQKPNISWDGTFNYFVPRPFMQQQYQSMPMYATPIIMNRSASMPSYNPAVSNRSASMPVCNPAVSHRSAPMPVYNYPPPLIFNNVFSYPAQHRQHPQQGQSFNTRYYQFK